VACTFAGTSVMHEHALKTRESSCVPRAAKLFFIHVVHSLSGAMGHVTAPELPSQEGRARSPGTCDSAGAHLSKETRFGAAGHETALELTSVRRRGPKLKDMWWHWSSPQQGGEVRGHRTRGGSGAHLCREVWSEGTTYVAARGCTSRSLF
jgi:hypothetical protein